MPMLLYCRAASLDVEPVYTFRGHVGAVLCLAVSASGEQCYSGGIDSTIRCWNIPSSNIDPYDSFGKYSICVWMILGKHEMVYIKNKFNSLPVSRCIKDLITFYK